jgi:hypothetical protein
VVAALTGKAFIGDTSALAPIFAQALAGGAVLALVAHAMIPLALKEGGSLVMLPTVAGFLFALYQALSLSFKSRFVRISGLNLPQPPYRFTTSHIAA